MAEAEIVSFAERLKARRLELGLSQAQAARELDVARTVFGPHWSLESMPILTRFYQDFPARPTCEALLAELPCPITARPNESEAIARIQQLLG